MNTTSTVSIPEYFGACLLWKTTADKRFVIYKYNPQVRGDSMAKPFKYMVLDTETGKKDTFERLDFVHCFIAYRRNGQQCAPWFGSSAAPVVPEQLVKHERFAENFGTKQRRGF